MKTLRGPDEATRFAVALVRRHVPDPAYRIFPFGSRAEGTAHPRSDIDIGIERPRPVLIETMALIRDELEERRRSTRSMLWTSPAYPTNSARWRAIGFRCEEKPNRCARNHPAILDANR